jgi:hypothetical protein
VTIGPTGCNANSSSTTTPKLAPPPRSAQNRSACSSALAVTTSPSAVTTRAARSASAARPSLRSSQPEPEPSVKPATPTDGIRAPVTASPCAWVAASSSRHVAPPWTRAQRRAGSTYTARMRVRSITSAPSPTANPPGACPPPRTVTGSSRSRAWRSAEATSCAPAQRAIIAGMWWTAAFWTVRASSKAASPGISTSPAKSRIGRSTVVMHRSLRRATTHRIGGFPSCSPEGP